MTAHIAGGLVPAPFLAGAPLRRWAGGAIPWALRWVPAAVGVAAVTDPAWGCCVIDPLSVSAVTAFLGSVVSGVASESGSRLCDAVGVMLARATGRETPAPANAAEREAAARALVAAGRSSAGQARAVAALMELAAGTAPAADRLPPRLLPAATRHFVDRRDPLRLLSREASRRADGRPRVALVYGPEAIGTSQLVFFWGSQNATDYRDGVLYVDLRGGGSDGSAMTASAVLGRCLSALGVAGERLPTSLEERTALYRTLVHELRLLVILDHAESRAQVEPLVTAAGRVFTVVVARRPLERFDAVPVRVGPLADRDARRLLVDVAGKEAVHAARAHLPGILRRCAGSPFALRAAASGLADPAALARAAGAGDGTDPVRAAVEGQYLRLPPQAARVFRLTGLRAWEAVDVELACAATESGAGEVRRALVLLEERGLLELAAEGSGDRYRFRPAVRFYATEAALREEGQAACHDAVMRCVERLLRFAVPADYSALEKRWHVGPLYAQLGKGPYDTPGDAVGALRTEAGNLVEAVLAAEDYGHDDLVCQLVEALYALQLKAGQHERILPPLRAGGRAADRHCPHSRTAGRMHTQTAMALMKIADNTAAEAELRAARAADEQAGHLRGQATASEVLGLLRLNQWRWAEALECFEAADRLLARIEAGGEGHEDVPRAQALLRRHRGRALRGMLRPDDAWPLLDGALAFFEGIGEAYNAARTRTDMADVRIDQGRFEEALELIARAASALEAEKATEPLAELELLRRRVDAERG